MVYNSALLSFSNYTINRILSPLSLLLLVAFLVNACSNKDAAPAPAPINTTDVLSNTTWEAYGYKDPVSGKEAYYYLAFGVNGRGQQYGKFNKADLINPPTDFNYQLAGNTLTLKYAATTSVSEYSPDKIKLDTPVINFVFTKL